MLVTFTYPTVIATSRYSLGSTSVPSFARLPRSIKSSNSLANAFCAEGFPSSAAKERGLFLIGREHHAEGGEDDVERAVGERKILGVRFAKGDREIFRERATARGLEKFGDVVGGSDFAVAARGGE
jgi:hypothetical protein